MNRRITTREEADALPANTIARNDGGPAFWRIPSGEWLATGDAWAYEAGEVPIPMTVLYTPQENT